MSTSEYLSTGEAARLIGISRSTVARRFDLGELKGSAHPITGERMIATKSVDEFLAKHSLPKRAKPETTRRLVLRAQAADLISVLKTMVAADRRLDLDIMSCGSEALIRCAQEPADLIVLHDAPSDIACPDLIGALRTLNNRQVPAILCCLCKSDVRQAETWGADAVVSVEAPHDGTLRQKIYELLHLAAEDWPAAVAPVEHRRRWTRHSMNVPGTIRLYRLAAPQDYTSGSVMVDNISLGGAGLSDVRVDSNSLPVESFRLLLQIDDPRLSPWQAHCQVVRLKANGKVTAGVQFVDLSQESRDSLLAFERTHSVMSAAQ